MAAATASPQSLPVGSPVQRSPSLKGLKKVLSSRRSSEAQSDSGTPVLRISSDSARPEKSPSLQSTRSPSRDDGSHKLGSNGVRKLIPGHSKRQRQRLREEELRIAVEEEERGRKLGSDQITLSSDLNKSVSSLFTDESETDSPPPLVTRDSHSAYLTSSSPLIKTTTIENPDDQLKLPMDSNPHNISVEQFPLIIEPENDPNPLLADSPSPKSPAVISSSSLPSPGLIDKADTLRPEHRVERRNSFSRLRGKSPARKFRDVFSKGSKSPRTSPERKDHKIPSPDPRDLMRATTSMGERRFADNPDKRGPSPLRAQTLAGLELDAPRSAGPALETNLEPPKTPPSSIREAPLTTVTPPTPTDLSRAAVTDSPATDAEGRGSGDESSGTTSSQNTNTINHRRIRSASSATHTKSKLSTSMIAPLTPTIEEIKTPTPGDKPAGARNITPGGGFFSSWVSAAQNAATTITNLTNQNNRSRSGTGASDPARNKAVEDAEKDENKSSLPDSPKKQLAVETMGTGNLNLAHLGFGALTDTTSTSQAESSTKKTDLDLGRDDAAAKMEDILARRAVSQAYEKPTKSGEATPVAEVPDPITGIKSSQTFDVAGNGTLTPPNGSIFEGEGGVKRSNSVRSKLANRRSRGSSVTTGQSAISAMVGASTVTLANPATGPKLSGFAIAPKQRNRAFHQQFRSVPEDDYLIEDYSCALQKEILLAGRLYISEGHICFSSNILGWVTTLIISFEEVVSVEKENTAIVIPNAIAVQTLHARHTFRSLLSREATFDLMIGIWKVSHPDSFQKSINSKQMAMEEAKQADVGAVEKGNPEEQESDSGSDGDSDADDDDGSAPSIVNSSISLIGSDTGDAKSLTRKASGGNGVGIPVTTAAPGAASGDATTAITTSVGTTDGAQDFPGPASHSPTECTDKATHYDKVIKDEIIPAPLGKIYSLLFGPQSGVFVRKFLEEGVSKAQDLQMEDDKKGLTNESKTKQYKYIKPLGGSIGPKQTSCITTETLDFLDLDKAVSVTCTTQTPDVPSGSAFSTKTRYCISWAPGNATRFQMNMTIEWTAKSWLKGPIEKGALDGQTQYGDDLVKTLKGALGRNRALTSGSGSKVKGKKKRKGGKKEKSEEIKTEAKTVENWGLFEPLRSLLGPFVDIIKPVARMDVVVGILTFLVLWMWFRGVGPSRQAGFPWETSNQRLIAYEQLWQQEENQLWEWLENRAGVDSTFLRESTDSKHGQRKSNPKIRTFSAKEVGSTGMKEMQHAVRITRERLDAVQEMIDRQRSAVDQKLAG